MATQEVHDQPARRQTGPISFDLSAAAATAVRRTTGMLLRHKLLIGTVVVLGTGLAALVALRMTPLYTAETLIMVEHRKNKVVAYQEVVTGLSTELGALQSEVAILKSPAFAEKVVAKLGLMNDPEFNAALRPETTDWLAYLYPKTWLPDSWWNAARGERAEIQLTPEEKAANEKTSVVEAFLYNLAVRPQGRSYVISVNFDSEDPRKAALIANTIGELYLVDQLDEKFKASKRATAWLEERIAELRREAKTTGEAVEKYRAESGLTSAGGGGDTTILAQQLGELNTNYVLARTKRQEAEAKYREVTTLMQSPRGVSAIGDVLGSPLIQALRQQEVELQRKIADATNRYGSKHPTLTALQSELRDLQGQIRADVNRIVQNLGNELELARGREAGLKASLDQLQAQRDQQQQSTVALKTLERDAETAQTMYEALLTRFQEIAGQNDIQQPDARVVSEAAIPLNPSQPNKKIIVLLALLASGTLGVLLALLREQSEKGFRSPHQFETATGVRSLGIVPSIPRFGGSPAAYAIDKPLSAFAESMQNLRTTLLLANPDGHQRVILFSSSVPGEGKSSIAAAFARICANSGQKTILLDCDMRRKALHDMLKMENRRGLYEVLSGECAPSEVIQTDPRTGLHFIASGRGSALPQDMLGSSRMHQLISRLALEYDRVILDSPPVLAVSEGKLLTALADQTVFVVHWGKTKRETAMAGLKEIVEAGGEVVGVLFSQVDIRRHAQYEFPDSGRYHGYRRYYAN